MQKGKSLVKQFPINDIVEEVHSLSRFGCTNDEIAEHLHIGVAAFTRYCHDYPEVYKALQQGRLYDSMKVVDSLHKQALGYVVTEHEEAEHMSRDGEITVLKKNTTKYIQPSTTAAIYLLKTRHGDKWMDIIKSEKTQNLNILVKNVDFSDVSDEDLLLLKQLGVKRIPEMFRQPKAIEHKTIDITEVQDVKNN